MIKYKVYTKEKGLVETDNFEHINELTWHREYGPALIGYNDSGSKVRDQYWVNSKLHRLNGPADIGYDMNGNIKYVAYWINDIAYTEEQYDKELLKLKVQSL